MSLLWASLAIFAFTGAPAASAAAVGESNGHHANSIAARACLTPERLTGHTCFNVDIAIAFSPDPASNALFLAAIGCVAVARRTQHRAMR